MWLYTACSVDFTGDPRAFREGLTMTQSMHKRGELGKVKKSFTMVILSIMSHTITESFTFYCPNGDESVYRVVLMP